MNKDTAPEFVSTIMPTRPPVGSRFIIEHSISENGSNSDRNEQAELEERSHTDQEWLDFVAYPQA